MPPPLFPEHEHEHDDCLNLNGGDEGNDPAPFRVESDILNPGAGVGQSIVSLDEPDVVADMDIPEGDLADDELPAPEELPAAVASAKKRGRPSATPGKTPSTAKTNGTASKATSSRKRKAEEASEDEATPVKRPRGRPARGAAATASARLAVKDAKKAKVGRPKGSGSAPKATVPKRGGPKGASKKADSSNSEVVPKGEYEVEEILESVIDADTFEHLYRVKWKGYPLDEATWEPKTNLTHAAELIRAFDAKQVKQTRKPRAANGTAAPKAAKAPKATPTPKPAKAGAPKSPAKKRGRPAGRPKKTATAAAPAVLAASPAKKRGAPTARQAIRGWPVRRVK
ncbi:hypothetical protein GE09DRAFT_1068294 [Coniochaeta sp. 2T2.1]|nr:hypothetical protein GE09DRAFT_1068294 [Coniochaeta sp. 2T2.1]